MKQEKIKMSESIRKAYDNIARFILKTSDRNIIPLPLENLVHVPLKEVYFSLFDILELPEFKGIDSCFDKLVEELSGVQSFPELKTKASLKLIELSKEQLDSEGSTALFNIEALKGSAGAVLIPHIINRQKLESENIDVSIRQEVCVDLRPLTYTHLGLQVVQGLGCWNFCGIEGLERVRIALDQLRIDLTVVDDEGNNKKDSVSISPGMKLVISEVVSDIASKDSLKEGIELLTKTNHPETISVVKQVLGPFYNHEYLDTTGDSDWGYYTFEWKHKITGKQIPSYMAHAFEPSVQALGRIGNREAKELLVRILNDYHYSEDPSEKADRQGLVVEALSVKPSEWLVPHIMKHLPSFSDMIDETGYLIHTRALLPMLSILVPYKPEGLFDVILDVLQKLYKLKYHEGNEEEIWKRLEQLEVNIEEAARVIDYFKVRESHFIDGYGRARGTIRESTRYPDVNFHSLVQASQERVSEDLLWELDDIRLTSEIAFEKEMLGRFIDLCRSKRN
jgi:hypothetical protein